MPPAPRRTVLSVSRPAAVVLVAGLVVTTAASGLVQRQLRVAAEDRLDRRASLVTQAVQSEADRYQDALRLIAASAGSTHRFTQEQFDTAVAPLRDMGLAGATSVAFLAPPVDDAGVAPLQRRWRERGAAGLTMVPSPDVDEHIFSIMSTALDGASQVRTGIDVAVAPAPAAALRESAATRRATITPSYVLLIDRDLPFDQRQSSFALTVPVRHDGRLRGWILMGIRGQDFAGGILSRSAQGVIGARVTATGADGQRVDVATVAPSYPGEPDLRRTTTVRVAQRTWTLSTYGDSHRIVPLMEWSPWPLVVLGLLITLLLGGLVQSLSARHSRAESRAREADEQLRGVTTRLEDLIWSAEVHLDGSMPAAFLSPSAAAVLGLDDLTGVDLGGVDLAEQLRRRTLEEDRPDLEAFFDTLALGDPAEVETRMRADDGTVRWMWSRGFPRRDGARLVVDGITSDVHRRKRLDQQRNQFLAIAGHEMRTPLTIIRGYAEYLMAEDVDPLARRHGLEAISRRSRQMESLLSDFFDLSRLETGMIRLARQPVRLDEVLVGAREDFEAAAREHEVDLELDLEAATVDADPVRLRQVVDNLVDNAVKYSRPGGRVRVSLRHHHLTDVRLVVSDDGIGVPSEEVALIFDRFYRASNAEPHVANGTGLGLSVVAAIVHGHGGRIEASSPPGQGLTVTVTLPVAATASAADDDEGTPADAMMGA
ncbi:ATP-binding protein [Nocardioides marmoribigeumensis]|uniref:histidine kinase n=1 Tax=Nocardioides marmoribigeumensis TaxID=433649 RepID=A0ABU2BYK6_9ACTN|nr:ATP-binding protein [Nocardioides marmoribigeumensis]MDR7363488.1 signal transduction histidine kinase [Nocardioides marmoribigeumensis]